MEYLTNPFFLALIAFILLLLLFDILQRLRRANVWKQIAADTGLPFSKHRTAGYRDQQLSGTYRKRTLTIIESVSEEYHADRRRNLQESDQNIEPTIRIKINLPQGNKLRLNRMIALGEVARVTGNAEIDRHFNIISEPNWLAQKVLASPNIQQKLPELKMEGNIFVQNAEILFSQRGRIANGNYLRFLLDFLSDLADAR